MDLPVHIQKRFDITEIRKKVRRKKRWRPKPMPEGLTFHEQIEWHVKQLEEIIQKYKGRR